MNIIIEPKAELECLKQIFNNQTNIKTLIVEPRERLGLSGASFYTVYYQKDNIEEFSKRYFCKIERQRPNKEISIKQEFRAYKEFVEGYLLVDKPEYGEIELYGETYHYLISAFLEDEKDEYIISELETLGSLIDFYTLSNVENFDTVVIDILKNVFERKLKKWIGKDIKNNQFLQNDCELSSFKWGEEYEWYLRWYKSRNYLSSFLDDKIENDFINFQGKKIINPVKLIEKKLNEDFEARSRVVHGDLHLKNIMVNPVDLSSVSIIDFGWTKSQSHCLKDYCLLESSLKFMGLSNRLNDHEILLLENSLYNEKPCPEEIRKGNTEQIYNIILALRNFSKKECKKESWTGEYLTALLFITTGYLGINSKNIDYRAIYISILQLSELIDKVDNTRTTLNMLGENKILDEIILKNFNENLSSYNNILPIGDDCSVVKVNNRSDYFAYSCDPCPTPMPWFLGDLDYYHFGWYSVLINLSDIASMGAVPTGILLSCIMDNNMSVVDLNRFIEGVLDCSKDYSCPVIGGNIKDGTSFSVHGTIIGELQSNILNRESASNGDLVMVIGDLGLFWTSVLAVKCFSDSFDLDQISKFKETINKPRPKVLGGQLLSSLSSPISCMDNSDGLTGCLYELSLKNKLSIKLDRDKIISALSEDTIKVAELFEIDPLKLALNWGDWQLVCTLSSEAFKEFKEVVKELDQEMITYSIIGVLEREQSLTPMPKVTVLNEKGIEKTIINFENERFSDISIFSHGLENYIKYLREFDLYG